MVPIGPSAWLGIAAAALSLACAVVFAGRVCARVEDTVSDGVHALMAVGMVAMFVPAVAIPPMTGIVLFAGTGLCAGLGVLRARRPRTAIHLAIVCAAMAMMFIPAPAAMTGAGHLGHTPAGARGELAILLALLFAGYFVWNAGAWLGRALLERPACAGGSATMHDRVLVQGRPAAHVVMSGLMASMFLSLV